ncbi:pyridoxamine 5'-phosphate oxidase [Lampropedia cohaerens]|uniref:Pyridoxine/pyridoxamine 5'-phosphate oxidase n=1 Tax=Lampropedia cohaerens TaxID=1610491 RepID=A0A0U1PXV0_9BURK|nr:pyridoxamine 5'-phosphate oxidase [Lampropedia cohaerens]KKW67340.1 pyridoxamine 5'-phosphate oxidase [Lampropedia cohaerens]
MSGDAHAQGLTLAAMRRNYTRGALLEQELPASPDMLFDAWLQQAMDENLPEPNAMTLATVGSDLRPSTRIVLLKGHDANGLVWFTNYQSRKGVELEGNPHAALQFHWVTLERVVRVEGLVHKVSDAESDAYFALRPHASQLGAWASPQSRPVASREALDAAFAELERQHNDGRAPARPPHWGGYRLVPQYWEFWQGRTGRLHDRITYQRRDDGSWQIQRLAP